MVKQEIVTDVPKPKILQSYLDQAELLLHEMHMSLQKPWMKAFEAMMQDPNNADLGDPFGTAEG
jgi:hypothetical protein